MKDVLIMDATLPAADNSLAYILEELTNKNSIEIIFNKIRNLEIDKIVLLPVHSNPEIDKMIKHGGETRQDRLNEYLAVNQNMKVVGLREATSLWIMGNKMQLKGGKKMVVFHF